MREIIITTAGWIDPLTGQPTRRDEKALRMWRYYNPKFLSEPVYFATPGVTTAEQAAEIGYNMVSVRLVEIVDEEEENLDNET